MYSKKILFCLTLFLVVISNYFVQAQEVMNGSDGLFPFERKSQQYNNNIGFTASYFSGIGFHYKRNLNPENSLKVVFLGWHSTEENTSYDKSADIWVSFGLEYQYHFFKKNKTDLYALIGYRTWYTEDTRGHNDYGYHSQSSDILNSNSISAGIGYETRLGKYFVANIDMGFRNEWKLERSYGRDNYYDGIISISRKRNKISNFSFAAGIGLGFVF
jgi:hypothetical protein